MITTSMNTQTRRITLKGQQRQGRQGRQQESRNPEFKQQTPFSPQPNGFTTAAFCRLCRDQNI